MRADIPLARDATGRVPEHLFSNKGLPRGLILVLLLALTLRVALLLGNIADRPAFFFQDPAEVASEIANPERPYMNPFGFEASNIAHALVCTDQGYASPFGGATGPTAWIAPGVVGLYAVSFALWGCFTFKSILFAYAIALGVSLVTTVVVFHVGDRVGERPEVGIWAALFFACLPFEAWIFAIAGHLDFNLQVLWFAVLLLAVLRAMDGVRPPSGFEFGAVSSAAAIFNPGFLICTAVGTVFAIRGRSRRETGRFILLAGLAHVLILGPVVTIQSVRLGGFVPVKSNAGFEVFLGNTPEARGILHDPAFQAHHPSQNVEEFAQYRAVGELRYVRDAEHRFRENVGIIEFLNNFVRGSFQFFVGYHVKPWETSPWIAAVKAAFWTAPALCMVALAVIRRGRFTAAECLLVLFAAAFSVPYLVAGVMERHRIPMVSIAAVIMALLTQALIEAWYERRSSSEDG